MQFMLTLMHKLIFVIFLLPAITLSQNQDLDNVAGDLIFLTGNYVAPAAQATTYQSSGGWYTTAKKKTLWDLEISLQANVLFIPNSKQNILVEESNLTNLTIKGTETTTHIPSALGGKSNVVFEGVINDNTFEFDAPEGLDQSYVNHYQVQAGLGLWKGTTLISRYSPKIKINKTHYQVFGFGLQHNISQWVPTLKESSFNLAGLVSYSNYNVSDEFTPANLVLGTINAINVEGESLQFNVLASKKIKSFDISAALGVNISTFTYEIGGNGELLLSVLNQALTTLEDNKTNFKADLGVNYNLNNLSINSMLTIGVYANVLFGINYNLNI